MEGLVFSDPAYSTLFQIYFFLVGLVVGSFLNVCIYRIPLKRSLVSPGSHCPSCDMKIPLYYNMPLISYILLAGKCGNCKARISVVYPIVELSTGLLFWILYLQFGVSIPFLIYAIFGCMMILLMWIDYFHRLLPWVITIPGIILGFAFSFINPFVTPRDSLIGFVIGGLMPFAALLIYQLIRHKEGLGHGDIVMLAMVGTFLGWQQVLLILFFSSLLGSIIGGLFILIFHKGSDFKLPYGTFIAIASLAAVFWGQTVWNFYMR
jgi:leader peptidase (prepilin peptidase) / N-methyltransferase